jgi:hypothetical protein
MTPVRIVTASYGNRYARLLLAFLESTTTSNPTAGITVLWSETDKEIIEALSGAYPSVTFEYHEFNTYKDAWRRIALTEVETHAWAAHRYPGENICHVDNDTLIIKDLRPFFEAPADVFFATIESGHMPVNMGVLLTKATPAVTEFLDELYAEVKENLAAEAVEVKKYGAIDQMSLVQKLGITREKNEYQYTMPSGIVMCMGVPCRRMNKVDLEVPATDDTHIIHYLGKRWHPVFWGDGLLPAYSRATVQFTLYRRYLEVYCKGLLKLEAVNTVVSDQYFAPLVPPFIDRETGRINETKRFFYYLSHNPMSIVRYPASRIKKLLAGS